MLVAVPTITLEECYFKILQTQFLHDFPAHEARLKRTLGRKKIRWTDLQKDSPQLIPQKYAPRLHSFRAAAQAIPIVVIEPEDFGPGPPELEPRMFYHIENVPILPKDAYLLAIAERLDVPHIAAMDRDFQGAANWLNVYTYL
jgi:predicted nucleic acid-binding protein